MTLTLGTTAIEDFLDKNILLQALNRFLARLMVRFHWHVASAAERVVSIHSYVRTRGSGSGSRGALWD